MKGIYEFLIKDIDHKLTILSPVDVIWAYMMISAVVALTLSIPLIAYQIWKYVSPDMKSEVSITLSRIINRKKITPINTEPLKN